MNHPRDWVIVAFVATGIVSIAALWMADMQQRRIQAAAQSVEGVKFALTPFERDRREAIERGKRAGVAPRWVDGGKGE